MLLKSLVAKGHIADHVQFATLRKLRETSTKNWESSPSGVSEGASFAKGAGRIRPTSCPAQSEWFYDFLRGMEYQMGCQSEPNHGLLIGATVHLLDILTVDAQEAEESGLEVEANELWKAGAYFFTLTAASLRWYEGFYMDLAELRNHLLRGKNRLRSNRSQPKLHAHGRDVQGPTSRDGVFAGKVQRRDWHGPPFDHHCQQNNIRA